MERRLALTRRNIGSLFSTDVPCVTRGRDNRKEKGLEGFNLPPPFHEWKGFSFWWPIWMYRQFRVLHCEEILILITSLISCDSQGEALPYPKSLCIAEEWRGRGGGSSEVLASFSPIFKSTNRALVWHWFANVSLLKVVKTFQMSANPTELQVLLILLPEESGEDLGVLFSPFSPSSSLAPS